MQAAGKVGVASVLDPGSPESWHDDLILEAQIIKTQRQILGFNLKTRKAKQSATGSYDPASRNLRMRLRLRAVSSCFIMLSRAGIKDLHHWD